MKFVGQARFGKMRNWGSAQENYVVEVMDQAQSCGVRIAELKMAIKKIEDPVVQAKSVGLLVFKNSGKENDAVNLLGQISLLG